MPRYFLELSYCGTNYNGWQIQSNTSKTIQQILQETLSITLKHHVMLIGCGRTDAGVHAQQFFAHFDSDALSKQPFEFWINKWNKMLPDDIAIHSIIPVKDDAHARYSAVSRTYDYHIHQQKDPFLSKYSWYFTMPLNHDLIVQALNIIKSHQDFAAFTKDADEHDNTLCDIHDIQWYVRGHRIVFTISANRFLRNMVRAIVGTLIWIGTGKFSLDKLEEILQSKDRRQAGFSAPPQGLYLRNIIYSPDIFI